MSKCLTRFSSDKKDTVTLRNPKTFLSVRVVFPCCLTCNKANGKQQTIPMFPLFWTSTVKRNFASRVTSLISKNDESFTSNYPEAFGVYQAIVSAWRKIGANVCFLAIQIKK